MIKPWNLENWTLKLATLTFWFTSGAEISTFSNFWWAISKARLSQSIFSSQFFKVDRGQKIRPHPLKEDHKITYSTCRIPLMWWWCNMGKMDICPSFLDRKDVKFHVILMAKHYLQSLNGHQGTSKLEYDHNWSFSIFFTKLP